MAKEMVREMVKERGSMTAEEIHFEIEVGIQM